MKQSKCVTALEFVRKLRGGSQPILVKASDGFLYVVKFQNSLQGPNILFNEAVGTELFRRSDLLVPEWRVNRVSREFITSNPDCWMETEHGLQRPKAGLCFGSRIVNKESDSAFETLAGTSFSRINNRKSFWTARILDVMGDNADNCQAIFLEGAAQGIDAYFIDHGHLFGGAHGTSSPQFRASEYLDARIYTDACQQDIDKVTTTIQNIDFKKLDRVIRGLPACWKKASAISGFERFRRRITDKKQLGDAVSFLFVMTEQTKKGPQSAFVKMREQIRTQEAVSLRLAA